MSVKKEMKEEEEKVNRKEIAAASLELVPERLPVQIVVSGTSARPPCLKGLSPSLLQVVVAAVRTR